MVQEMTSWGNGVIGTSKLASTREQRCWAMALVTAAGLVMSVTGASLAGDEQPRPATPPAPKTASPTPAPMAEGADIMFKVSNLNVQYEGDLEGGAIPAVQTLMRDTQVELVPVSGGFTAPREGVRGTSYSVADLNSELSRGDKTISQRGLESVLMALRDGINRRGVVGVWVELAKGDVEVRPTASGSQWVDVRQGRTSMNVIVYAAKVAGGDAAIRTIGIGERVTEADAVNNKIHDRIRRNSPVKGEAGADLLNKGALDNYAFRLSRHPGRQVDIAVGAGPESGTAQIDYMVRENKPWSVYFQIGNTGTESTNEWRERFGFVHNQLTNEDDILSIDYVTAGFDSSHSVQASYERPVFDLDRLRVKVFGGYNNWDASEVGVTQESFSGDGYNVGGQLSYNVYQWQQSFLDVFGGVKFAHYRVNNSTILLTSNAGFFLPYGGVSYERNTGTSSTRASVQIEGNIASIGGTPSEGSLELDAQGRGNTSDDFAILSWNVDHSMYLEPIFDGKNFRDGKSTLAHEIYLSFRGQTSLGDRLTPNFQGVAGGFYTVRGYDESEAAGDDQLLFTAEYRLHIPRLFAIQDTAGRDIFGEPFRWSPQEAYGSTDWDLIFRGFVDIGWTGLADKLSFESDKTLVGPGIGLELQYRRNINLRVDWGIAANDTPRTDAGESRVHFVATFLY